MVLGSWCSGGTGAWRWVTGLVVAVGCAPGRAAATADDGGGSGTHATGASTGASMSSTESGADGSSGTGTGVGSSDDDSAEDSGVGFIANPDGGGSDCDALIRPRMLSDAMGHAWLTHNVGEVANLEHFLPELFEAEMGGRSGG